MANIFVFPNELLYQIAEDLSFSEINSFSSTCHTLHSRLDPILYRIATKRAPYLLAWACETRQVGVAGKLLAAGQNPNVPHQLNESRPLRIIFSHLFGSTCPGWSYSSFKYSLETSTPHDDYDKDVEKIDTNLVNFEDPLELLELLYASPKWPHLEEDKQSHNYHPQNLDTYFPSPCYWFPLHSAAKAGCNDIINLLISYGSYLDLPSSGFCRCMDSCRCPYTRNRDYILDRTPPQESVAWTPLHTALCSRNEATANLLISLGASPSVDLRNPLSTVLHSAAAHGCLLTLQYLIDTKHPFDVNAIDQNGLRPLVHARDTQWSLPTYFWLVTHGADPNTSLGDDGYTVLHAACLHEKFRDAMDYIEFGADIHAFWKTLQVGDVLPFRPTRDEIGGFYPINIACRRSFNWDFTPWIHPYFAKKKLGYPFCEQEELRLALRLCNEDVEKDRVRLVEKLIKLGAAVDPEETEISPLNFASASHLVPIVELLVSAGADTCRRDAARTSHSPLYAAVHSPLYAAVHSPLYAAVTFSHRRVMAMSSYRDDLRLDTVTCLLDHGVGPEEKSDALRSLCHERTIKESQPPMKLVQLLLERGADPKAGGFMGGSILEDAIYCENYSIASLLIQNGAMIQTEQIALHFLEILLEFTNGKEEQERICRRVRFILEIDKHGWLIKSPKALWLASSEADSQLAEILMDNGASDPSWASEGRVTCIDQLAGHKGQRTAIIAERLISLGILEHNPNLEVSMIIAIAVRNWALVKLLLCYGVHFKPRPVSQYIYPFRYPGGSLHPLLMSMVEAMAKGIELDDDEFYPSKYLYPLLMAMGEAKSKGVEPDDDETINSFFTNCPVFDNPAAYLSYLHGACAAILPQTVATLISLGADVNASGEDGSTSILLLLKQFNSCKHHEVDPKSYVDLLKILVDSGAKLNVRCYYGSVYDGLKRISENADGYDEEDERSGISDEFNRRCVIQEHPNVENHPDVEGSEFEGESESDGDLGPSFTLSFRDVDEK